MDEIITVYEEMVEGKVEIALVNNLHLNIVLQRRVPSIQSALLNLVPCLLLLSSLDMERLVLEH